MKSSSLRGDSVYILQVRLSSFTYGFKTPSREVLASSKSITANLKFLDLQNLYLRERRYSSLTGTSTSESYLGAVGVYDDNGDSKTPVSGRV